MDNEAVDVKENNIYNLDCEILSILLKDNTTDKNIIWATDNYISYGDLYKFNSEITISKITSYHGQVIRPRIKKSKQEQQLRSREKAEVFTPSWICNKQNNLIDNEWFGYQNVFNTEKENTWITNNNKIKFKNDKTWEDYLTSIRLEISCGEAPYLVSRYDTVTGDIIDVTNRIGLLDRKFRVLNENVDDKNEWFDYVVKTYKSIYAYEWQGDNLLIARENLLYTFIDNFKFKFDEFPNLEELKQIAEIISWNIFQMDGIKFVIPNSCKNNVIINYTLFGDEIIENECIGCKKNRVTLHNGIYCKVMNWSTNRKIKFISLLNRRNQNGK
ncbi:MAG: restriction endonuclease subunit M [Bacilli bacterium]